LGADTAVEPRSTAVEVHVKPVMSKADVRQLVKDKVQMEDKHFNIRVEGETTLVFKPEGLLAALVCDVPDHQVLQDANDKLYRGVAKNVPTRISALGVPSKYHTKPDGTPELISRPDRNHPRYIYARKYARDGVMGALDPTTNKAEYARIKLDVNDIPTAFAHAELLRDVYAEYAPEHYQRQMEAIAKVHPHWAMRGLPFTTATDNWCFPTYPHVESGDFKPGLGIITVKYYGACPYSWLVLPRYDLGILVKAGDVLLVDVGNEVHANTAIPEHDGYGTTSGRLATIHYLRPKLANCGTPEEESRRRELYLAKVAAKREARQRARRRCK